MMGPTATDEHTEPAARPLPMDPRIRERRIAVRRDEGRRRLRVLVALVSVATLVGGALAAAHSALLDVDHVEVVGAQHTSRADIVRAAGLDHRRYLVDVHGGTVRAAVDALPWVARTGVERRLPGTVKITVIERKPVAQLSSAAGGVAVVDASGRVLDDQPLPGLVQLAGVSPAPPPGERLDDKGRDALMVASALPDAVRPRVAAVSQGADGIDLRLAGAGGATVELGSVDQLDAKIVALGTMLAKLDLRDARVLDLRVPAAPVLTRVGASR